MIFLEGDMSEIPISDTSSCSSNQNKPHSRENFHPVDRLFDHLKTEKPLAMYGRESDRFRDQTHPTSSFCTPTMASSTVLSHKYIGQSNQPSTVDDQFLTPTISNTAYRQIKSDKTGFMLPLSEWPEQEHIDSKKSSDDGILSEQNISNLLEKDDSLAQRVKDLLEDESAKSDASDKDHEGLTTKSNIPKLLQQIPHQNSKNDTSIMSETLSMGSIGENERILLSNTSLPSVSDVTVKNKTGNSSPDMLKTLNLLNESALGVSQFNDQSSLTGDTLSLNTSKGTEYGDLPDTVDIPHDIMVRLNNMRMIGQEETELSRNSGLKEAWVREAVNSASKRSEVQIPQHTVDQHFSSDSNKSAKTGDEASAVGPIAGDVKFHVGSNPTTPQFPIEEEKLQQLQSYIEKKTGMPSISPLVAGDAGGGTPLTDNQKSANERFSNGFLSSAQSTYPVNQKNVIVPHIESDQISPQIIITNNEQDKAFEATNQVKPRPPTTAFESTNQVTPRPPTIEGNTVEDSEAANKFFKAEHPTLQLESANMTDVTSKLHPGNFMRSDPEGMSPPIVSSSGTALTMHSTGGSIKPTADTEVTNRTVDDTHGSAISVAKQSTLPSKDESYLEENLADDSILARIKCALSESFSQNPASMSGHVPTTDVQNRSEVSFASSIDSLAVQVKALLEEELPHLISTDEPQNTSNLSEAIENFEQTDLWKYVAQFIPSAVNVETSAHLERDSSSKSSPQKNSLKLDESVLNSTLENSILERIRAEIRKSSPLPSSSPYKNRERIIPTSSAENRISSKSPVHLIGLEPVSYSNLSPILEPDNEPEPVTNPLYPKEPYYKESDRSRKGRHVEFDPIPGIPDFARSVLYQSGESIDFSSKVSPSQVTDNLQDGTPKSFSHCQTNARNIIESQLNRAAQRNFDVSLTPARHMGIFSEPQSKLEKDDTRSVPAYHSQDTNFKSTDEPNRFEAARPPSAYFRSNPSSKDLDKNRYSRSPFTSDTSPAVFKPTISSLHTTPSECNSRLSNESLAVRSAPSTTSLKSSLYGNGKTRMSSSASDTGCNKRSVSTTNSFSTSLNSHEATPQLSSGIPPPGGEPSIFKRHYVNFSDNSSNSVRDGPKSASLSLVAAMKTSDESGGVIRRSKSPLRDRVPVQEWLKSPVGKTSLSKVKYLPTFEELMEEQAKEEIKEAIDKCDQCPLQDQQAFDKESRSGRNSQKKQQASRQFIKSQSPLREFNQNDKTSQQSDRKKLKEGADWGDSSIKPLLNPDDSYQKTSLFTDDGSAMVYDSVMKASAESDIEMQRQLIAQTSSSETDVAYLKKGRVKLPRSISEFHALDEKDQHEVLKKILLLVNKKRNQSQSHPAEAKSRSTVHSEGQGDLSLGSNQAVCDSDSTEYCDLPSTRPPTALTSSNSQLLSSDETKAEQVVKRLLEKIKHQKEMERAARKKCPYRRNLAKSSTPERIRPPMTVPEASSIASTDTDAGSGEKYYIRIGKRNSGHKKVFYLDTISDSEVPVTKIKRRHKKSDAATAERIVLYDRSIQTASSSETIQVESRHDVSTNFPSPVKRTARKKTSKAVQTAGTQSSPEIDEDQSLDDTMVLKTNRHDNKENIDVSKKKKQQRFSSFYVDMNRSKKKAVQCCFDTEQRPKQKPLAWYEPFRYEPLWMQQSDKQGDDGLVPLSLQEALASQHPAFISKSRERLRRIAINSDERRMQEIWAEERQRVFGSNNNPKPRKSAPPPRRRPPPLSKKQIIAETRQKYEQLPEVQKRKKDEERKREYASNRLKAQLYKKKIQNKILGRCYMN